MEDIKKLRVKNIPTPKCKRGEVLVKVEACGICRTDMKAYNFGQRDLVLPRILGHEIAGTIVATGKDVSQVQVGDRVQVAPGLPCGVCSYCLAGHHQMCDAVQIMGFHYNGGFAEYVLVPTNGVLNGVLNKIPEHLTFNEAVFTEPLACSINMQDSLKVSPGDTVVIFGAGPLGLLNARLAKAHGAGKVILVEINEERLASPLNEIFDITINGRKEDPTLIVLEATEGSGADVVIPCCPTSDALAKGLLMLGKRGRFGFFSGLINDEWTSKLDLNIIHYKELSMYGAYGCSSKHNRDALALLSTGIINVEELVTRVISLDEAQSGLEMVKAMSEIKVVINFISK